jgi:hypothetical protein
MQNGTSSTVIDVPMEGKTNEMGLQTRVNETPDPNFCGAAAGYENKRRARTPFVAGACSTRSRLVENDADNNGSLTQHAAEYSTCEERPLARVDLFVLLSRVVAKDERVQGAAGIFPGRALWH